MPRFILYLLVILLLSAGAAYYEFVYPPSVYTRISQRLLDSIDDAFASQNRTLVGNIVNDALDDNAQIILQIGFPTLPGQTNKNVEAEQFTKTDFLRFVDNTLYALQNYNVNAAAQSITLSEDKTSGTLSIRSREQADGLQMDNNLHYTGETICSAETEFDGQKRPKVKKLSCVTQLRYGLASTRK